MNSYIESYLLEKTDRLLFISLRDSIEAQSTLKDLESVEIPVFTDRMKELALEKEEEGITAVEIAKAMVYILGIDGDFKYKEAYVNFLSSFTDSPANFVKDLVMKSYRNRNLIDSIIYTRGYLHSFPGDEDFLFNYGALCEEYGQETEEESCKEDFLREAKQLLHPFFGAKVERAVVHMEEGEWQLAEKLLLEVLQRNNRDFDGNFYLGYLKRIHGEYDKALDYYEKAYEVDNKIPKLINEMALCFSLLGDFHQALELFEYAYSLDPTSKEILCNISMVYLNLNDLDNARKYANLALERYPEDEIAHACLMEIRKYEE